MHRQFSDIKVSCDEVQIPTNIADRDEELVRASIHVEPDCVVRGEFLRRRQQDEVSDFNGWMIWVCWADRVIKILSPLCLSPRQVRVHSGTRPRPSDLSEQQSSLVFLSYFCEPKSLLDHIIGPWQCMLQTMVACPCLIFFLSQDKMQFLHSIYFTVLWFYLLYVL